LQAPPQLFQHIADEYAGIDDRRSWSQLAHHDALGELLMGEPLFFMYKFPFEKGQHGINAAESECADLEKDL